MTSYRYVGRILRSSSASRVRQDPQTINVDRGWAAERRDRRTRWLAGRGATATSGGEQPVEEHPVLQQRLAQLFRRHVLAAAPLSLEATALVGQPLLHLVQHLLDQLL